MRKRRIGARGLRTWLVICLLPAAAAGQCAASLASNPDRTFLVGSYDGAGPWRVLVNGQTVRTGAADQLLLLHADGSLNDAGGRTAAAADGVGFAAGRWGGAFELSAKGTLAFGREGAVDFREGTIEMWIAPRADGLDAAYADRDHTLFGYRAASGETMNIAQSRTAGIVYAGGTVRGQWESAYGGRASSRAWLAGEWHHVAFTFSEAAGQMRFYLDGALAADTNEKHYWAPEASGARFTIGDADYWVDEVRILNRPLGAEEVRASAGRTEPARNHEVWLPADLLARGDSVAIETDGCSSAPYAWRGVPVSEVAPASTLLAAGATEVAFSMQSMDATSCTWAVGSGVAMPFDDGQEGTVHRTVFRGLSADPSTVNRVAVRCASDADYTLALRYRALPKANPAFPRKGNLWGSAGMAQKGLEYAAKVDLYLGAGFSAAEIQRLHALNPQILILTSINTVENSGLPEDYYLHTIEGKRIEVWPGTYRLNLTKTYVAEYQAKFAYQTLLDAGLMADGCFFDNFFTTQSWLKSDIWGHKVQLDADEDGQPDDPAWLDREWGKGVYHELGTWRKLMPWALASGHLSRPPQAQFASIFNGDSIGFMTSDALEGKIAVQNLWDAYQGWWDIGRKPVITMVESTPQDQISYGYSYAPAKVIPASTLEFARTYYPNVRFGLGVTLMNDGYFAHEFGDTWHGNDWWYDELDFNLGYPLGAAERVPVGTVPDTNLVENGGFEQDLAGTWRLNVVASGGAAARVERVFTDAASGVAAAHITVTNPGQSVNWHVEFAQYKRSLVQGKRYDLIFAARALAARSISLSTQKDAPDYRNYGLSKTIALDTAWQRYKVTFQANETVQDARVQFWLGASAGEVWLDDVQLVEHPADLFRREFTNGLVLLNATAERQTVSVGSGWRRLTGKQAPMHEYILDAPAVSGNWREAKYDTGEWTAVGPFYHAWNGTCKQSDAGGGTAEWALELREDGTYTIDAWWAAAPGQGEWTRKAVYEVVAGGRVVATATLDQASGGDEWHAIATVPLAVKDAPVVRLRSEGSGPLVADALHLRSVARLHDGSPASVVVLEAMDSIILSREK